MLRPQRNPQARFKCSRCEVWMPAEELFEHNRGGCQKRLDFEEARSYDRAKELLEEELDLKEKKR